LVWERKEKVFGTPAKWYKRDSNAGPKKKKKTLPGVLSVNPHQNGRKKKKRKHKIKGKLGPA